MRLWRESVVNLHRLGAVSSLAEATAVEEQVRCHTIPYSTINTPTTPTTPIKFSCVRIELLAFGCLHDP